jgi:hypothetical protein
MRTWRARVKIGRERKGIGLKSMCKVARSEKAVSVDVSRKAVCQESTFSKSRIIQYLMWHLSQENCKNWKNSRLFE